MEPAAVETGAAGDHLPRCATCAHARVIPGVRPLEWRCRGGQPMGGRVYRGEKGALTQHLLAPRECEGYEGMG